MENDSRIEVTLHDTSDNGFCGIIGRFTCISISTIKQSFRLFDGGYWYEFKTDEQSIRRIKDIALRDKGSLYVKIRPSGLGYILDETLR